MFYKHGVLEICVFSILLQASQSGAEIERNDLFLNSKDPGKDIADLIVGLGHVPKDGMLPESGVEKKQGNDASYILSKLSDEELVKLLNTYPKKTDYNLNDIINFAALANGEKQARTNDLTRFKTITSEPKAFFKLDNKPVIPYKNENSVLNSEEGAAHKLKNLLFSRPVDQNTEDEDGKKEILFDILVTQLKSLCCKKNTLSQNKITSNKQIKPLLTDFTKGAKQKAANGFSGPSSFMFLIINDDIPVNVADNDGLISVDPESLDEKSSVLLLGPILQQLSNPQLKLVMNRITNELSRPEYLPLLQQIADGNLDPENMKLMKSLVSGPDTRRYIKPHRCNYQSKLARVYGGPRWIVCTGYLNINTPSIYD